MTLLASKCWGRVGAASCLDALFGATHTGQGTRTPVTPLAVNGALSIILRPTFSDTSRSQQAFLRIHLRCSRCCGYGCGCVGDGAGALESKLEIVAAAAAL